MDLLVEAGPRLIAVEMKSGKTVTPSFFRDLTRLADELPSRSEAPELVRRIVYGGDEDQHRTTAEVVGWSSIQIVDWT